MFENKELKRIPGPKKNEMKGSRTNFHSEELYSLYSSSNIVTVIKQRKRKWSQYVARKEKLKIYTSLVGGHQGKPVLFGIQEVPDLGSVRRPAVLS
jgi:hypothetical protein